MYIKQLAVILVFLACSFQSGVEAAAKPDAKAGTDESWAKMHMREEHNIEDYDPRSFFSLHDSDKSDTWTRLDIMNLYGVYNRMDPTGQRKQPITPKEQRKVVEKILDLMDTNKDDVVSMQEWIDFNEKGGELPDFGLGPGHHGDVEYEYELHHWLKYHSEDDSEESLTHPEDIEHEKIFHNIEHQVLADQENNIPAKFLILD
ncbi:hypothetical protein V1511DRAFT_500998 [Dipodascopsis uninucleata]